MKRLVALLVVAGMAAVSASAQKTKQGDRAWLFTLNGLSNLGVGGYNGGLGLLYYLSDDMGLTVGLGFGTTSTTEKAPTSGGADEKTSALNLTLSPGLRFNLASSGPIVGYAGVGISFGMGSETVENPQHVSGSKVEVSTTTFGAAVTVGAEWFAWSNVSLGASYSLGFSTSSGKQKVTTGGQTTETDAPSVTNISTAPSGSFTLSIYW
ncbi:MAG: outer membrane beta-barrel protein [Candidatus Kapabacteria bacterium]|nr:outer membrane beta-barrel protein [Candidatus Kapabacteria bacterium]MDW8225404.1 outer membrane beta-barrel protein [Bacteroidota bacterium]